MGVMATCAFLEDHGKSSASETGVGMVSEYPFPGSIGILTAQMLVQKRCPLLPWQPRIESASISRIATANGTDGGRLHFATKLVDLSASSTNSTPLRSLNFLRKRCQQFVRSHMAVSPDSAMHRRTPISGAGSFSCQQLFDGESGVVAADTEVRHAAIDPFVANAVRIPQRSS